MPPVRWGTSAPKRLQDAGRAPLPAKPLAHPEAINAQWYAKNTRRPCFRQPRRKDPSCCRPDRERIPDLCQAGFHASLPRRSRACPARDPGRIPRKEPSFFPSCKTPSVECFNPQPSPQEGSRGEVSNRKGIFDGFFRKGLRNLSRAAARGRRERVPASGSVRTSR